MSDDLTLWQQVLGAEHAAIYGYGLVGAVADLAEAATSALVVHRQRRGVCLDAVAALGGVPEASAPAYDVTRPADAAEARDTAAGLEAACWPAYLALTGSDDRRTRLTGAGWLRESVVRAQAWNGSVAPLPGLAP
jgi:hypothetical protein